MPTLHITKRDGSTASIVAAPNLTLMEAMAEQNLDVEAVCGGVASCGTCHVHIAPEWLDVVGVPEEQEADLLAGLMNADASSRLGCQIILSDRHNGLNVRTAQPE